MTCEKASLGGVGNRSAPNRQLWSGESSSPLSTSLGSPRRKNKICLAAASKRLAPSAIAPNELRAVVASEAPQAGTSSRSSSC